jgi:hypothetical protein
MFVENPEGTDPVQTLVNCPFLLSCEGVASWRKVSLSVSCRHMQIVRLLQYNLSIVYYI